MYKTNIHFSQGVLSVSRIIGVSCFILFISLVNVIGQTQEGLQSALLVKKCNDFAVTGNGTDPEWTKTEWNPLTKLDEGGKPNASKFKILYSETGIYVLFQGEDEKIT